MTGLEVVALVETAISLIGNAGKLIESVKQLTYSSENLTELERAQLIARIEEAKNSIPKWDDLTT